MVLGAPRSSFVLLTGDVEKHTTTSQVYNVDIYSVVFFFCNIIIVESRLRVVEGEVGSLFVADSNDAS